MNNARISQYYQYLIVLVIACTVYPIGNVTNFLSVIVFCCLILRFYSHTVDFPEELMMYFKAVFVWAIGCLVVSLTSDAVGVGVHECYKWFIKSFGLIILPFVCEQKTKSLKFYLGVLYGIVTVLAILIAYRGIFLHEIRVGGYFTKTAMLEGILLGYSIPGFMVCFFDKGVFGKYRWLAGCALALNIVALAYNNTRGAELGAMICSVIVCLVYSFKSRKNFIVTIILSSLLCGFIISTPAIRSRWDRQTDGRIVIWQTSWQMFKDNPIVGVGFHRFKYAYKEIYHGDQKGRTGKDIFFHAHNLFINAMVEGGIVGLATFVFYFNFAFMYPFRLWREYRDPYSLMMLLTTLELFINGMVETVIVHDLIMRTYWILMGILLALHLRWKQEVFENNGVLGTRYL